MNNKEYKTMLINKAYKFSLDMMKFLDLLPKKDFSVEAVARQVIRSATSIGANIVEAQASSSKRDFINFIRHALKSANETRYWLGLLRDSKKVKGEYSEKLLQEAKELSNLLASSLLSLKKKK